MFSLVVFASLLRQCTFLKIPAKTNFDSKKNKLNDSREIGQFKSVFE